MCKDRVIELVIEDKIKQGVYLKLIQLPGDSAAAWDSCSIPDSNYFSRKT